MVMFGTIHMFNFEEGEFSFAPLLNLGALIMIVFFWAPLHETQKARKKEMQRRGHFVKVSEYACFVVIKYSQFFLLTPPPTTHHSNQRKLHDRQLAELIGHLNLANDQLKGMKEKSKFSADQVNMVNAKMKELVAIESYKVNVDKEIKFGKILGEGSYGVVYLAQYRGEKVAVKQILSNKLNESSIERFKEEVSF